MADLALFQNERRSYLVPIAAALVLLGGGLLALLRYTPHRTADLSIPRTATWQTHTVFKNETIQVGRDTSQEDLYVLATLHIDDKLRLPLFVKDLTASLTTAEGEVLTTSAVEKADLAQLLVAYPALKKLTSAPLYRDTEVPPSQAAEGIVLLHFPITETVWQHRQAATLTVDFYHQSPQTIPIPQR